MKLKIATISLCIILSLSINAQEKSVKDGYSFGALPVLTMDSDFGFMYGAMARIFNYGDGSSYPDYQDYYNVLISRYASGCGRYEGSLETSRFIKGMRINLAIGYKDKQLSSFYGYNGYESEYHQEWINRESDSYRSRMFYNTQEDIFSTSISFESNKEGEYAKWGIGMKLNYCNIYSVDVESINRRKSKESDYLPLQSEVPYFFEIYRDELNLIKPEETKGWVNSIYLAFLYDKRDNRMNTMDGIYFKTTASLFPKFAGNGYNFMSVSADFRQYIKIIQDRITFAYRIYYNQTVGDAPFRYYFNNTAGGMYSIRGVNYSRIMAKGYAFSNLELRTRPFYFNLLKGRRFVGINLYYDAGLSVSRLPLPESLVETSESIHSGAGGSLMLGFSPNFAINMMLAKALDSRDGTIGFGFDVSLTF